MEETLSLFGVPDGSPLRSLLWKGGLTATQIISCLGRALHPRDAERALRTLLLRAAAPGDVIRYASACSGIDLFAVAMDAVFGMDGWRYVAASECRPRVRKALLAVWACRGLSAQTIAGDACSSAAVAGLPPADLWFCSPPCEAFSRRNHERSDHRSLTAADAFDSMLEYPRRHRPALVVVENVDEPDAVSIIDAGLRSLEGYVWASARLSARDHGPMTRVRRWWMGRVLT